MCVRCQCLILTSLSYASQGLVYPFLVSFITFFCARGELVCKPSNCCLTFFSFWGFVWNSSYTIVFNNYTCILMFLLPTATVCLFRLVLETSYIVLGETFSNCSAYIIRIDSNIFNWITLVYDTRRCITIFCHRRSGSTGSGQDLKSCGPGFESHLVRHFLFACNLLNFLLVNGSCILWVQLISFSRSAWLGNVLITCSWQIQTQFSCNPQSNFCCQTRESITHG